MEFEVGKLYKSKIGSLVVICKKGTPFDKDSFCGEVVIPSEFWSIGATNNDWRKDSFELYNDTVTLQNGHKYSIPKGCKATIKDDVVIIEEDIEYSKSETEGATVWTRTGINSMQITCWNGLYEISTMHIEIGNTPSCREEFEEAYKKAMDALKL